MVLPGLKERASYRVSVASKNEAGVGPEVVITLETGLYFNGATSVFLKISISH